MKRNYLESLNKRSFTTDDITDVKKNKLVSFTEEMSLRKANKFSQEQKDLLDTMWYKHPMENVSEKEKSSTVEMSSRFFVQNSTSQGRSNEEINVYIPCPITSGEKLYDFFRSGQIKDAKEVYEDNDKNKKIRLELIEHNHEIAKRSPEEFRNSAVEPSIRDESLVIAPSFYEYVQEPMVPHGYPFMNQWNNVLVGGYDNENKPYAGPVNVVALSRDDENKPKWYMSTGGVEEITMATFVEAGLRPNRRPTANMQFVSMDDGHNVSLSERIELIGERIKKDNECGMHNGKVLTCMAQMLQVHDMVKANHDFIQSANPRIKQNIDVDKVTEVRNEIEPILIEKASKMELEGLPQKYINAAGKKGNATSFEAIEERFNKLKSKDIAIN